MGQSRSLMVGDAAVEPTAGADVALDPTDVGLFCTGGIVLQAYGMAHLVKQFPGTRLHETVSPRTRFYYRRVLLD